MTALSKWVSAHMAAHVARASGGGGGGKEVDGAEHIWLDTCAGGVYWPPCNAKCPPPDTVSFGSI